MSWPAMDFALSIFRAVDTTTNDRIVPTFGAIEIWQLRGRTFRTPDAIGDVCFGDAMCMAAEAVWRDAP